MRVGNRTHRTGATLLAVVVTFLGLTACTPTPRLSQNEPAPQHSAAPADSLTLAVTPASGTRDTPISTEVGITVSGGTVAEVSLVNASTSQPLYGMLRNDMPTEGGSTTWIPAVPLAYNTPYTATVTAHTPDGSQTKTQTTSFTTMGQPERYTGSSLYLFDGQTVGVGMPVVLEFDEEVPVEARAAVQSRLFVATNPPQPGVWHWASGREVWYRAPDYWRPGTTIAVRAALAGLPMGNATYGDTDHGATAVVSNKVFMEIDNATKQMQVFVDDQNVRTIPVSLGKPSTPSSSGAMVVMTKEATRTFDTRGEPDGGYVVDVNWAMRLTWGGEFIHAAPWSVGDQGNRNVSHGCVNMADEPSYWLFQTAHIGDPIIVRGTEAPLAQGNGWTAWNFSWAEYVAGSALPVPPELANATGIDPLTGRMPAPPPAPPAVPAAQPSATR
jgi:lipoprotein-anchoring transpeptidase ErfK/SrfK